MRNFFTNLIFTQDWVMEEALARCEMKGVHLGALEVIGSPDWRLKTYDSIVSGTTDENGRFHPNYKIQRAYNGWINKKTGEWCRKYDNCKKREVLMSGIMDVKAFKRARTTAERMEAVHGNRLMVMCLYLVLCKNTKFMVHKNCKSYQEGVSCGKTVNEAVRDMKPYIARMPKDEPIGRKYDLSKYFDNVDRYHQDMRPHIHGVFDAVEAIFGKDDMISVIRDYYDLDEYYDTDDKEVVHAYKSLKQGCPIAAWLANVILYQIDEAMTKFDVYYVRYSDDMLIIGPEWKKAEACLESMLAEFDLDINDDKKENLYSDKRFVFLGFSIKGDSISLSPKWVYHFCNEIDKRTWDMRNKKDNKHVRPPKVEVRNDGTVDSSGRLRNGDGISELREWDERMYHLAVKKVRRFLYEGDGVHSWASQVLPYINDKHDIHLMSLYVLDCLRAVRAGLTNKQYVGNLCYEPEYDPGAILRQKGIAVHHLRLMADKEIDGLVSVESAYKAMHGIGRDIFKALARECCYGAPVLPKTDGEGSVEMLEEAYRVYERSVASGHDAKSVFAAVEYEELSMNEMLSNENRPTALKGLLQALSNAKDCLEFADGWFWQSKVWPQLVVLKRWVADVNRADARETEAA